MQLNKQLTATLSASAIGATYEWSSEHCTCITSCTACSCVSFSTVSGSVDVTLVVTSTVSYPDDCSDIIIKLTTTNEIDGETCVDHTYYEITKDSQGTQLTWACASFEDGCKQITSLTPIFDSYDECIECTTCPCSTTNPCASAEFVATYDCDTKILTIDTTNAGDWCDGIAVLNYIDIDQALYDPTTGQQIGYTLHHVPSPIDPLCGPTDCLPAFPISIDCTDNPLPEGIYSVAITISLSGCLITTNNLWVSCSTGVANAGCCLQASADDIQYHQQGEPPRVYSIYLDDPSTTTMTIEFQTFVVADKLSVFTTWDPNTLTGNEIATTDYIGACDNQCNDYFALEPIPVDFYQGYREKEYDTATLTINYDIPCGIGTGYNTADAPVTFTVPAMNSFGSAKLILTPGYLNTQMITDNIVYIVVYSNQNTDHDNCFTVWQFHLMCGTFGAPGYQCPCVNPAAPLFYISEEICGGINNTVIQPGYIEWTSNCPLSSDPQWSIDGGVTWTNTPVIYDNLETGHGSVCIRCTHNTAEDCYSDVTCVKYDKPTCCSPSVTPLVRCNTNLFFPYSAYKYELIFTLQDCTDYILTPIAGYVGGVEMTQALVMGELIVTIYCNDVDTNPIPSINPGMSHFRYVATCSDCGSGVPILVHPSIPVLNGINALECAAVPTRCCTTMLVLPSGSPITDGKLNITVNGGAPLVITFAYNAGAGFNTASEDFGYTIDNINLQLLANGITGEFTFEPLDFETVAVASIGCLGLPNIYNKYTLLHFKYNCGDEIVLTLDFSTDYNVLLAIDADINITPELTIHEDGDSCTIDSPECGFCVVPLTLRTLENIIIGGQYSQIEFDDVPGCGSVGNTLSVGTYSILIIDPSDNSNVPNSVIALKVEDPCGEIQANYGVVPYTLGYEYTGLQPNYNYYFQPNVATTGLFTIHVEDGRGCAIEYPLCVIDYEIETCPATGAYATDLTLLGAGTFTGITVNNVLYNTSSAPYSSPYIIVAGRVAVDLPTAAANIKADIEAFLLSNVSQYINGTFTVTVQTIEPHKVSILLIGCDLTDTPILQAHFTETGGFTPYDVTGAVVPAGNTYAYLSDGPFDILTYSWDHTGLTPTGLTPTDEAYTTYVTAEANTGDELTCAIQIECGLVTLTKQF